MREDRDLRIDAGLILAADDIEHAADGVTALARILEHLDVDDVAGLRAVRFAAGNQHLGTRLAALEHEVDAALAAKLPDDARLAARENLDDVPFPAAARVAGTRGDAIAVPEQLHLARGEIEIVAAVVGPEKPNPSRCASTTPVTRSRCPVRQYSSARFRSSWPSRTMARMRASSARRCCSVWISKRGARASSASGCPACSMAARISSRLGILCS